MAAGPGRYNDAVRPRFHTRQLDVAGSRAALDADEAGHLTRVLRLGPGADVDVFDGSGAVWRARVDEVQRDRVTLQLLEPAAVAAEPAVRVTLVVAVLKGDKMDDVVRDAAMMGVAAIQPVVTKRTEMARGALVRSRRRERWERVAVSSVKQCGRGMVPGVLEPVVLAAWQASAHAEPAFVLVEPFFAEGRRFSAIERAPSATLIVGPEGGWTAEELDGLERAGVTTVSLGPRTLRADAVPVAALAALFEAWGAW